MNACLQILVVLLLGNSVNVSAGGSRTPSSKSLAGLPSDEDKQSRIDHVQRTLNARSEYVMKGKRSADFQDWIREQGGEPKIFSMHGVDVNFEMDELDNMELDVNIMPISRSKGQDPFLPDRMNLNIENCSDFLFNARVMDSANDNPPTTLQLSLRAAKLSMHFAPVLTTVWLAAFSKKFRCGVWYKWVAHCLASSGAAFIKWGQWAATRSDMFPLALCDALSNLHNDAPSHVWDFTKEQVETSLNIPPGSIFEVFKSFDEKPLASGSIAQVHKAQLHNGEIVAAKVRHPRVAQLIDMDFRLMAMVASLFDMMPTMKGLSVKDSVSQFSHTMAAQAYLNVEAHHLEVLNHNFRSWQTVRFPEPFYASSSLILETFEEGQIVTGIIDDFDSRAKDMDIPIKGYELIPVAEAKFLVTTGVSMYLKMLLLDNLMHADLHPGNIMLRGFNEDGKDKYQITLVDAGMVAQLTDQESSTFIGLLTCVGEGDGAAAAEFALQFGVENNISGKEKDKFKKEMVALFEQSCQGYGTNVDVGEVLRGILGLIQEHRIRIDANYATLVINILCVESLGRKICPSYNVLDAARPLLQTYRRVVYQGDGYTPKRKNSYNKRIKKLMPVMLYGSKQRADNAFFKQIEATRRTKVTGGSVDQNAQ